MPISHESFISRCRGLAEQAASKGNHPFGALLVKDGEVFLTAENAVVTSGDITAHAELELVRRVSQELSPEARTGTTLYVSTEPCVMCCGAIYWARIPRVVYGVSAEILSEITGERFVIPSRETFARIEPRVEVVGPLDESEGVALHRAYWKASGR